MTHPSCVALQGMTHSFIEFCKPLRQNKAVIHEEDSVYKLSNYINRNGEIIPQAIIDKAPSAELHPNQKDQDRLPPYEILDNIIEMYLEQNKPLDEIYAKHNKEIVDEVVRKIYRFQFKRKQCCLGVRLTERSFAGGVDLPIMQRFY